MKKLLFPFSLFISVLFSGSIPVLAADVINELGDKVAVSNPSMKTSVIVSAGICVAVLLGLSICRMVQARIKHRRKKAGSAAHHGALPTQSVSQYRSQDPSFDEAALCRDLKNLYLQIQFCREHQNAEPLRKFLSSDLCDSIDSRIRHLAEHGRTDHCDDISINSVELIGFRRHSDSDHLSARFVVTRSSYTVDDRTNVVTEGERGNPKTVEYHVRLTRKIGVSSADAIEQRTCAACGAPLESPDADRCPYCGCSVVTSLGGWVVFDIHRSHTQSDSSAAAQKSAK